MSRVIRTIASQEVIEAIATSAVTKGLAKGQALQEIADSVWSYISSKKFIVPFNGKQYKVNGRAIYALILKSPLKANKPKRGRPPKVKESK
jgi:hypothetical protein